MTPDLTTFGKIIGGGMPVGAVGGREEIMGQFDPRRSSHLMHAGTFNGNPMTLAAGCVSLDLLPAEEIERINGLGARLAQGLRDALGADGTTRRSRSAARSSICTSSRRPLRCATSGTVTCTRTRSPGSTGHY